VVKNAKGIQEEELTWSEFERLFRKKLLFKRYHDDMENEFYEFNMGYMTDEEYTSRSFELLRYVYYLNEEKAKIQIFISGFSITFNDITDFDEPISFEEVIKKLKHYYRKSMHKSETKQDWNDSDNNKGKFDKKRTRPQEIGNKENATPHKMFNASDREPGFQYEE